MKNFLRSVIDVRKGEFLLTLLMFLYYYLLLVTYYFLKPARDSLFLVQLGPQQLPIVFMLTAVIVVPVVGLYSSASRALKLNRLINVTTVILIVNLVALRWMLGFSHSSVFYIFYIWVSIYGAITTSQFWLLANGVFDATQAKRLFVMFSLGGIVGAFTGGEVTSLIIRVFDVSTENLLFFCMAFLGSCILLVNAVWTIHRRSGVIEDPAPRRKKHQKEGYRDTFRMMRRSRHLMLIVGIIAMTMATASFVDFQFKTVSVESFPTKQDLTSFLGQFYGRLSLIAFLFQLLISYRFLRVFGVGGAIMLLPLGLTIGTGIMLVMPGLLAGVFLRGADGVFKYSIDKTGRELLFLPVPLEVKKRTKIFIDVFVDRWFRGFAGAALLLFVAVLHFSVQQLSIVVMVLLVVWLGMVLVIRKEYVNSFRRALERREIDVGDLRMNIAEASTLETLRAALGSNNDRQIMYALDMLSDVQDAEIVGAVVPLMKHGSPDVRRRVVRVLRHVTNPAFVPDMERLLDDVDPFVRREAMHYICRNSDGAYEGNLEKYVHDSKPLVQATAIACIAEYGSLAEKNAIEQEVVERLLAFDGREGELVRAELAESLGLLANPQWRDELLRLMDDPSPLVVLSAMRGVGRTADRAFVPRLLKRMADKRYRKEAREALALFGDRITGTLTDYIIDKAMDFPVRTNIIRVMSQIPTQHSVDSLVSIIDDVEPELRFYVIKGLNKLRTQYPGLQFDHVALNTALLQEVGAYYAILQALYINGVPDDAAGRLLGRTLAEKIDRNLERIFRLLGLRYPSQEIYGAYLGYVSTNKQLRASAIEFLDNVLKKDLKRYIFPIVDNIPTDFKVRKGQELFGVHFKNSEEALAYLINGPDPWLRACAMYAVRTRVPDALRQSIEQNRGYPHPVVSETAALVLRQ